MGDGERVGPVRLWAFRAPDGTDTAALRDLALRTRGSATEPAVVLAVAASDGKVAVLAATDERARDAGVSAREVLQAALPAVGGRGGGKDDVAQGGGTDESGIEAALAAARDAVAAAVTAGA